jgi:hypothetical protein
VRALIVGIPKGFDAPDWRWNYINIMPMGAFAVANHANRAGHRVRVMNAAALGSRARALDTILERVATLDASVVGIPIHWHLCAYDACRAAATLKRHRPELRIVVGGLTATVFARELLGVCPAIDAVVLGDGERPFADYLDALDAGGAATRLARVPNLCWRDGRQVVVNPERWVASAAELSELDFSIDPAMLDITEYVNGVGLADLIRGRRHELVAERTETTAFFLNVGRGCSLDCVYCAGSAVAAARYSGRPLPTVRSVGAVVRTVASAAAAGFRKLHVCFDPPFAGRERYFRELFERIRAEAGGGLTLLFEAYQLPSRQFLESAARCFERAVIILSPCLFDSALMPRLKGYSFTHAELRSTLDAIGRHDNLGSFVFYAITPFDDWSDGRVEAYAEQLRELRDRHGCQLSAQPILAEPGSPWVGFPGRFPGTDRRLAFDDFWRAWQQPLDRWSERLCGLPRINEIVERLDELTADDSLSAS